MMENSRKFQGKQKSAAKPKCSLSRKKPLAEGRIVPTNERKCDCDPFMLADKGGCDCWREREKEAEKLRNLSGGASLGY